jgi:RimJ/RimL family protein N-acetyltransferase
MPDLHLRVLTAEDADWVLEADRQAGELAVTLPWDSGDALASALDRGEWATDEQWAWAVVRAGEPIGFVLVTGLDGPDAEVQIRIIADARGRGAGREVLRQLADHHFAASDAVRRLAGRTHERNVPMQRAFTAAGFRMEARYRDTLADADGSTASEWGYALTRHDWEEGRHRVDDDGYDLHGRTFLVEEDPSDERWVGTNLRVLQEGRRVIARYDGPRAIDGELAGILTRDVVRYWAVHLREDADVVGHGRLLLQRRGDGRLELLDEWEPDHGTPRRRTYVEIA